MTELRKLRHFAGWTQYKLSAEIGIDRTKLSLFENGHLAPRPDERGAIYKVLLTAIARRKEQFSAVLSHVEPELHPGEEEAVPAQTVLTRIAVTSKEPARDPAIVWGQGGVK